MNKERREYILDLIENCFHLDNENLKLLSSELERLEKYDSVVGESKLTNACFMYFSPTGIMLDARYGTEIHNKLKKLEDIYEGK